MHLRALVLCLALGGCVEADLLPPEEGPLVCADGEGEVDGRCVPCGEPACEEEGKLLCGVERPDACGRPEVCTCGEGTECSDGGWCCVRHLCEPGDCGEDDGCGGPCNLGCWRITLLTPDGPTPPPRSDPAMAYDAATATVVVFGGGGALRECGPHRDTWLLRVEAGSVRWEQAAVAPEASPPARSGARMVAAWGSLWLLGGMVKNDALCGAGKDLWRWDGAAWSEVPEASPWPKVRHRFAMALDEAAVGQRIVVHGGAGDDADTWTLRCDGDCTSGSPAWASFTPGTAGPHVSAGAAAACWDAGAGRVRAYGGDGTSSQQHVTWSSAESWEPAAGTEPGARFEHVLAWTEAGTVLFGGALERLGTPDGALWVLAPDAMGWRRLDPPDDGMPRPAWNSPGLVAVPELGGVLAFGGEAQGVPTNDLWLIQPPP